jgi:hypothetical protein
VKAKNGAAVIAWSNPIAENLGASETLKVATGPSNGGCSSFDLRHDRALIHRDARH